MPLAANEFRQAPQTPSPKGRSNERQGIMHDEKDEQERPTAPTVDGSPRRDQPPSPQPSIVAPLGALGLALVTAYLVLWCDWPPGQAMLLVAISSLGVSAIMIGAVVLLIDDRAAFWEEFWATVRADLQPFVQLWRVLRGKNPD